MHNTFGTFDAKTHFSKLLEKVQAVDNATSEKCFHEILGLAYTQKLTSYDTAYLELAMRKGLPLASRDNDLCTAAKKLGIIIL